MARSSGFLRKVQLLAWYVSLAVGAGAHFQITPEPAMSANLVDKHSVHVTHDLSEVENLSPIPSSRPNVLETKRKRAAAALDSDDYSGLSIHCKSSRRDSAMNFEHGLTEGTGAQHESLLGWEGPRSHQATMDRAGDSLSLHSAVVGNNYPASSRDLDTHDEPIPNQDVPSGDSLLFGMLHDLRRQLSLSPQHSPHSDQLIYEADSSRAANEGSEDHFDPDSMLNTNTTPLATLYHPLGSDSSDQHRQSFPTSNSALLKTVLPPNPKLRESRQSSQKDIDAEAVRDVMSQFREKIVTNISKKPMIRPDTKLELEEPPVLISSFEELGSSFVRVFCKSDKPVESDMMITSFRRLLKSIFFTHPAFSRALGNLQELERAELDGILTWLLQQFSSPSDSLPVFGLVDGIIKHASQVVFGPVQSWLSRYFSRQQDAQTTSIAIIGIWYKNYKPEMWKFETDQDYWDFMAQVIGATKKNKTREKWRSHLYALKSRFLENVYIADPRAITSSSYDVIRTRRAEFGPCRSKTDPLEPLEIEIIDRIEKHHSYRHKKLLDPEKHFQGVSLGAVCVSYQKRPKKKVYSLRLVEEGTLKLKKMCPTKRITTIFNQLLKKLQFNHLILENYFKTKLKSISSNPHNDLLHWLSNELFERENGPPMFGNLLEDDLPLHNRNAFSAIQLLLIDQITKSHVMQWDWDHISKIILGYWYKNKVLEVYQTAFKDDMSYWKYMTDLILKDD